MKYEAAYYRQQAALPIDTLRRGDGTDTDVRILEDAVFGLEDLGLKTPEEELGLKAGEMKKFRHDVALDSARIVVFECQEGYCSEFPVVMDYLEEGTITLKELELAKAKAQAYAKEAEVEFLRERALDCYSQSFPSCEAEMEREAKRLGVTLAQLGISKARLHQADRRARIDSAKENLEALEGDRFSGGELPESDALSDIKEEIRQGWYALVDVGLTPDKLKKLEVKWPPL